MAGWLDVLPLLILQPVCSACGVGEEAAPSSGGGEAVRRGWRWPSLGGGRGQEEAVEIGLLADDEDEEEMEEEEMVLGVPSVTELLTGVKELTEAVLRTAVGAVAAVSSLSVGRLLVMVQQRQWRRAALALTAQAAGGGGKSRGGLSPLMRAVFAGRPDLVEGLLLKGGMAVDERDDRGRTALWWAARWGEESIVRLLLQSGADGQACDREGATPEMAARVFGSKACVELLQDAERAFCVYKARHLYALAAPLPPCLLSRQASGEDMPEVVSTGPDDEAAGRKRRLVWESPSTRMTREVRARTVEHVMAGMNPDVFDELMGYLTPHQHHHRHGAKARPAHQDEQEEDEEVRRRAQ